MSGVILGLGVLALIAYLATLGVRLLEKKGDKK